MAEGDNQKQAEKRRPIWRKGEAGELFKKIFEETFNSKATFNPLFDVEVEVVRHTGNAVGA